MIFPSGRGISEVSAKRSECTAFLVSASVFCFSPPLKSFFFLASRLALICSAVSAIGSLFRRIPRIKRKLGVILASNHGPIPARRGFKANIRPVAVIPAFVNQEALVKSLLGAPAQADAVMAGLTRLADWPGSWRRRIPLSESLPRWIG